MRVQPRTFRDALASYIVDLVLAKIAIRCIRARASSLALAMAAVFVVFLRNREVILLRQLRR